MQSGGFHIHYVIKVTKHLYNFNIIYRTRSIWFLNIQEIYFSMLFVCRLSFVRRIRSVAIRRCFIGTVAFHEIRKAYIMSMGMTVELYIAFLKCLAINQWNSTETCGIQIYQLLSMTVNYFMLIYHMLNVAVKLFTRLRTISRLTIWWIANTNVICRTNFFIFFWFLGYIRLLIYTVNLLQEIKNLLCIQIWVFGCSSNSGYLRLLYFVQFHLFYHFVGSRDPAKLSLETLFYNDQNKIYEKSNIWSL